jgi:hypothetical protein
MAGAAPAAADKETAMQKGQARARLVALFVSGWLLLNFPLLALWDRDATLLGLPLFPAALFVLWGALIALLAWLMERSSD